MNSLDEVSREGVRNILRDRVVEITFTKTDGSQRVMNCTLQESVIPTKETTSKTRTPNPEVCSVWDVDKQAWRSFRWDSITKIGV